MSLDVIIGIIVLAVAYLLASPVYPMLAEAQHMVVLRGRLQLRPLHWQTLRKMKYSTTLDVEQGSPYRSLKVMRSCEGELR